MFVARDRNKSCSGKQPCEDNSTCTLDIVVEQWETVTETLKVGKCMVGGEILSPMRRFMSLEWKG
jgi:hypothetical protein